MHARACVQYVGAYVRAYANVRMYVCTCMLVHQFVDVGIWGFDSSRLLILRGRDFHAQGNAQHFSTRGVLSCEFLQREIAAYTYIDAQGTLYTGRYIGT